MKLKDDFFKIENISINDDKVEYAIRLNLKTNYLSMI